MTTSKQNSWTIVSTTSSKDDQDTCSWLFFDQGALGLEIIDIDEKNIVIKASFNPKDLTKEQFDELNYRFLHAEINAASKNLKIESVDNEDWLRNWKKHFEPFTIGDSFLICPPWHTQNITKSLLQNRTKIIIDPGTAFGTGLHPTTAYCLNVIGSGINAKNILDVGTGSGILAIASALTIPNAKIIAIEIDDNAIPNAKHNIELNQVQKNIDLILGSPEDLLEQKIDFDTILSNLTAEVIIDLLPTYNKLLKARGTIIFAGIIEERLQLLETHLAKYPLKIIDKTIEKGWIGLTATKN